MSILNINHLHEHELEEIYLNINERISEEPNMYDSCALKLYKEAQLQRKNLKKLSAQSSSKIKTKKDKSYKCRNCLKSFGGNFYLQRHINNYSCKSIQHASISSIQCSICKETFSKKIDLKRHNLEVHNTNKEQHYCKKCQKSYETVSLLKKHILTFHIKRLCSICHKAFSTIKNLADHLTYFHRVTDRPCNICPRICKSDAEYKEHVKKHSTGMEKSAFSLVGEKSNNGLETKMEICNRSNVEQNLEEDLEVHIVSDKCNTKDNNSENEKHAKNSGEELEDSIVITTEEGSMGKDQKHDDEVDVVNHKVNQVILEEENVADNEKLQ